MLGEKSEPGGFERIQSCLAQCLRGNRAARGFIVVLRAAFGMNFVGSSFALISIGKFDLHLRKKIASICR